MSLFSGLTGGVFRMPDSAINYGNSPLPVFPPGAAQFTTPDGRFGDSGALLPGGLQAPYAYGNAARISTQTQQAHPNKVQLVIPRLCIPSPESDGLSSEDPVLQHALSDGDLVFAFRMGAMAAYGSQYVQAPYGFSGKAVALVNLATVNYLLWGLQVGLRGPKNARWRAFFNNLTKNGVRPTTEFNEDTVWNFLKTHLRPFGIQHGGDQQGGLHEVDGGGVVTHGAVDYVSSFAIEGKLRHISNLWRDCDVRENEDLILALRYKAPPHSDIPFVLSSSVRATRNERVSVTNGFYYLRPEVLQFRTFSDVPYIHIARGLNYCGAYTRGLEAACFNARIPVTPGAPLHGTFEPKFVDSDRMFYQFHELEEDADELDAHQGQHTSAEEDVERVQMQAAAKAAAAAQGAAAAMAPPPHQLRMGGVARTGALAQPAPAAPAPTTAAALLSSSAAAVARQTAGGAPTAKRPKTTNAQTSAHQQQQQGGANMAAATTTTATSTAAAVMAMLGGGGGGGGSSGRPPRGSVAENERLAGDVSDA